VTISDDDVKNYFYNHYAKTSAIPMSYKLQLITISIRNYKSSSAAHDIAQNALKEIRAGDSFEEVARRSSDDATAASGGDLPSLSEDQMAPVIRAQAKKLQIGQVSEVFGGPQSGAYLILKLVDAKSSDSEQYEKKKEQIRNQLIATEYQHQIALWLDRQRLISFIHHAGDPSAASFSPATSGAAH
jgi:parvulin-like peptidyl-prolyl isomerase